MTKDHNHDLQEYRLVELLRQLHSSRVYIKPFTITITITITSMITKKITTKSSYAKFTPQGSVSSHFQHVLQGPRGMGLFANWNTYVSHQIGRKREYKSKSAQTRVNIFLPRAIARFGVFIVEDVILGYLVAQQDNLCIDHISNPNLREEYSIFLC